jgi:hypothetical protein
MAAPHRAPHASSTSPAGLPQFSQRHIRVGRDPASRRTRRARVGRSGEVSDERAVDGFGGMGGEAVLGGTGQQHQWHASVGPHTCTRVVPNTVGTSTGSTLTGHFASTAS